MFSADSKLKIHGKESFLPWIFLCPTQRLICLEWIAVLHEDFCYWKYPEKSGIYDVFEGRWMALFAKSFIQSPCNLLCNFGGEICLTGSFAMVFLLCFIKMQDPVGVTRRGLQWGEYEKVRRCQNLVPFRRHRKVTAPPQRGHSFWNGLSTPGWGPWIE